jgi:hypothetical protein
MTVAHLSYIFDTAFSLSLFVSIFLFRHPFGFLLAQKNENELSVSVLYRCTWE